MRKKKLLSMQPLLATEEMHLAIESGRYLKYFRAAEEDGILKVAIFFEKSLKKGTHTPEYEVYCDKQNREFLTYEPAEERWRTAKIEWMYPGGTLYWRETWEFWQTEEDRKLVNEYFSTGKNLDIQAAVLDFQNGIRKEELRKKHRTEIEAIDEVMREVPELPENFENWIVKNCFRETMFYEPESSCRGRWQKMYCTNCKTWMDTKSWPNRPEHNKDGECPNCGAAVTYKSWNMQKYVQDETQVGLLQRLRDDSGWILRKFHCKIKREHSKGWTRYELSVDELEREQLGKEFHIIQTFQYGPYKSTRADRWCYEINRGYYGGYQKFIHSVVMYTPNLKSELRKESFGQADMEKIFYGMRRKMVEPARRLQKLYRNPYVEYLQKSGLDTLTEEVLSGKARREVFNLQGNRVWELVQLDRQRFKRLVQADGGVEVLYTLQYEQKSGQKVTDHNLEFIKANKISVKQVLVQVKRTGMNLQRMLNYLERQMELTKQDWDQIFNHYVDYLNMAAVFDMNIIDEIVCRQPKMMEYHDRYVERKNRDENRTRDKEVDIKYPDIRENLQKNRERFAFQTEEFVIVVPTCASDITKEGRVQHHCVGASDRYIKSMNDGETFILFLRRLENPEDAYYTLEVTWNGEIKQFYAAYDRQPYKENIRKVLEQFTKAVQEKDRLKETVTAPEAMLLAAV